MHPKAGVLHGQRSLIPECSPTPVLQGPRAPCEEAGSTQLGWESLSCCVPWHTIPSGRSAGHTKLTPSSPGYFALVMGVQLGCHLGVHPAQAAIELTTIQLLQLHLPVPDWPRGCAGPLLRAQGTPQWRHSSTCKASASKNIPQTHGVNEELLVLLAPLAGGTPCPVGEGCSEHGLTLSQWDT